MKLAPVACVVLAAFSFTGHPLMAASALPQDAAAPPAAEQPSFKPEELEQMLAPLALYPDSLLAQIFMASTYPIEVVEADRWVKAHPDLKGDALAEELEKQTWDPSVRSLAGFPPILAMMSENLSTTVQIGDAFIGQPKEVMDTVQKLRAKADATGNLKSTDEQVVKKDTSGGTEVIVIESSSPEVIYVPQYNPTVVYGTWPYPAYPPAPYYPPGYGAAAFGVGLVCGAAWGYAWGNCDWNGGDCDININQNNNFNTNIDRSKYQGEGRGQGSWKHDPSHRQGAAYRNSESARRAGAGTSSTRAAQARSDFRGKAEAGRSDLNSGAADNFRGNQGSSRPSAGTADRGSTRPSAGSSDRAGGRSGASPSAQPSSRGNSKNSAFSGSNKSGSSAKASSSRGSSSRSASPSSRSASSRSSPSRSSGGGSRGGGGRR